MDFRTIGKYIVREPEVGVGLIVCVGLGTGVAGVVVLPLAFSIRWASPQPISLKLIGSL